MYSSVSYKQFIRILTTLLLAVVVAVVLPHQAHAQVYETVTQNVSDDTDGVVGRFNFFDPVYGNSNTNAEDARIVVPLTVPDSGTGPRLVQKISIEMHDHDESLVFDLRLNANQLPNLLSNVDIKTSNGARCNQLSFKTKINDHHYPQNASQDADCYSIHTIDINQPISKVYLNISRKSASGRTSAEQHVHIRNVTWSVEKKATPVVIPDPQLTVLSCVVPSATQQLGDMLRVDWGTATEPIKTVAISDSTAANRWDATLGRFWSKEVRGASSVTAPSGFFPRSPTTPNPLLFQANIPYSVVLWDGTRLSAAKDVTFQACSQTPERATADLATACVTRTSSQPLSYNLVLSNVDTKGLTLQRIVFYLHLEWNSTTAKLYNFLGTPSWSDWTKKNRAPQDGDQFGYEIATVSTASNNQVSFAWDNTQRIGGTGANQKQLADLTAWVSQNNFPTDFTVSTQIETGFFGNTIISNPAASAAIKIGAQACVQNPVCVPNCGVCSLQGSSDGCSGSCNLGSARGTPNPVEMIQPKIGEPLSVTQNSVTISWKQQSANTAQSAYVDAYQALIYPSSAYASAQAAVAAYQAGASNVVFFYKPAAQQNPSFVYVEQVTLPQALLTAGKITIAIRSLNLTCPASSDVYGSSGDPGITPPNDPGWPNPPPTDLQAAFSGNFYKSDSCSLANAQPISLSSSSVVTITDSQTNQDYSGSAAGSSYAITVPPVSRDYITPRLKFDQAGQPETLVCAACNPADASGACIRPRTSGPTTDAHFFLQSYNLKFDSWWQARGGLVYGHGGIRSAIPVERNPAQGNRLAKNKDCADTGDYCEPYLIRKLVGGSDLSAGIPYSGGSFVDIEGWWTDRLDNARANNGVDALTKISKENYTFFMNQLGETPSADITTSYIDSLSKIPAGTAIKGALISYRNGNLTFDPDQTWIIPSGEKRVIFVNGDLTFSQTPAVVTSVEQGGFLAFIVSGNIIFDPSVGHASPSEVVASNSLQPTVEGVFIANAKIIIQSAGSDDKKFVGAGTFVGWSGVELQRTFEKGQLGRIRNNTTPVENFLYRPDFLIQAPELLKASEMVWREVN